MTERPSTHDFYTFCEALLKLEWPGRRVAVTPAPYLENVVAACDALGLELDARGVVDVTIGSLSESEPAFVCFRLIVRDEVSRNDWPAVAAALLERGRHDFGLWATRAVERQS